MFVSSGVEDVCEVLFHYLKWEEAVGRLTAYEERLKSQDEPQEDYHNKLLMASSSNQGRGRGRGRNFSKEEKGRGRGTSREQSKKEMRCYECGELGHFAYECTKWKDKDKKQEAHLIYQSDDEPTLL